MRYIDVDAFIKTLEADIKEFGEPDINTQPIAYGSVLGIESALDLAKEFPTADVVPKSEVERLQKILDSYALQYGTVKDQQDVIDKANQELASEIFEEIEKISCVYKLDGDFYLDNGIYTELKKKYTEGEK